jgi:hypothetical protein
MISFKHTQPLRKGSTRYEAIDLLVLPRRTNTWTEQTPPNRRADLALARGRRVAREFYVKSALVIPDVVAPHFTANGSGPPREPLHPGPHTLAILPDPGVMSSGTTTAERDGRLSSKLAVSD